MRLIALSGLLLLGLMSSQGVNAASIYAGHATAAAVCSQCHGIKTPSADAPFPPLAGRDADYLKTTLKQYRDKTRKSDIMNAIVGSLSDSDISNVATYYARLKP
ncbi:cytochrome c [Methylobacter sp. G7]|uniref:c-type cytochrome n=1 Tax=Methylobacter sp. G7 TaxID=3230117 RepID=UPI003D809DEF